MENLLKNLNVEQLEAVRHKDGPLLIVAGAGTGKTTILTERLNYLIKEKLAKTDEILITTFTEKAASEMEERADKILPYGYVDLWIYTFHGFCERLLRDHALDIGLSSDFKLLSQTEQWMLIRRNLYEFDLDYYRPLGNPTKFIHELIKHFSRLKDENISASDYLQYADELEQNDDNKLNGAKTHPAMPTAVGSIAQHARKKNNTDDESDKMENVRIIELANAYHKYNQLLLDNGFLDFGDLINFTIKLFKDRPNILKYYQEKFKYIMVDEFQDTNWSQYELIKILTAPKNNLVVVGDDDQSIYKFRGASLSNIMQFKDDYPRAKEIVLTDNYRSGKNILDKAYNFIRHNDPNRLEAKLKINKKLKAFRKENGLVEHLHFKSLSEETKGVIEKIIEIKNNDKEVKWSDFAILVRANDSADNFVAELTRHNIPNIFYSLRGLFYKPIIIDIIAYLRLLDNYHESSALFRVLNMEIFKVGYSDIININKFAAKKAYSLYEALEHIMAIPNITPEAVNNINKLLSLIKKHSLLAQKFKVSKVLVDFFHDIKLTNLYDFERDKEVYDYLNQFYQKIKKLEGSEKDIKVKEFIEVLEMEMEAGDTGALKLNLDDSETVKVMTIHAAKGLEFKYVFIVNLVDKKFPTIARSEKINIPEKLVKEKITVGDFHLEEERRLFYVAMTRARDSLFLTSASDYGGAREKKISIFLKESGVAKEIKDIKNGEKVSELLKDLKIKDFIFETKNGNYAMPKRFSFSQIEGYNNCPLQYKFNFILKIPTEEKVNYIFGRLMHSVLKEAMSPLLEESLKQGNLFLNDKKEKKFLTEKEAIKIYEDRWINDGYPTKNIREKYYLLGKKIIAMFFDKIKEEGVPDIAMLEKSFSLKIGQYIFRGTIDRVDRLADGTYEIIDYKTGSPKQDLAFDKKMQLLLYYKALEVSSTLKISKLTFYYLTNCSKFSFSAKAKDIEKLESKALDVIAEIKKGHFPPKANPEICRHCDYNMICEFRA